MSFWIDLVSKNLYPQTESRSEFFRKSYGRCFLAKNQLKLLRCRDGSDQSQRKRRNGRPKQKISVWKFVSKYLTLLSIISKKRIVIQSYFLRIMLVSVRGIGAVCVSDQPGDEAILVNQMVSDRSKLGGYRQRTYWVTFLPEGLKS